MKAIAESERLAHPTDNESSSEMTSETHPDSFPIPIYGYKVVNVYPHDIGAFTQGLAFENGLLFEGTGLCGSSTLRKVELETGNILQMCDLPDRHFGEGVTLYGNKVIQLTWRSGIGFAYDKESFDLLLEFRYPIEGWGITHDDRKLIMSDGSATLHFLDPETFGKLGQIKVHDRNGPVVGLNELEYIRGEIYANVWPTDRIARIAPDTGELLGWIDLNGLLTDGDRSEHRVDVLNGIAHDAYGDRLFVTGKWWPKLFEIELVHKATFSPDQIDE